MQAAHELPELRLGIGIATGPLLTGHIGSRTRRIYTVMGNTVNLASRFQQMTREVEQIVLMSETTAQAVGMAELAVHGSVTVRGKQHPVLLFSLPMA